MIEFFANMTSWHWLVFGIGLIALEIALPGTFLLWPGLAAIIVGLVLSLVPGLAWTSCVGLWAVLSVLTVVAFIIYRNKHPDSRPVSLLNRRGEQYVGQRFTLEKPIVNGKGDMKVDDTIWKVVSNQDIAANSVVVVTMVEGTSLRVIPAENA